MRIHFQYGPRYNWGAYDQGLLLGAFFYSYSLSTTPMGFLLDRYGIGRQFIFGAFVVSAVAVVLSPLAAAAADDSIVGLFVLRLVIGVAQGGTYPNVHRLISTWAPPAELGLFMVAAAGSNVGTVLAWTLSGALIEQCGWQWSFYANAILVVAFLALWWYNAYDRPSQHPRITAAEQSFIEQSKPQTTVANVRER